MTNSIKRLFTVAALAGALAGAGVSAESLVAPESAQASQLQCKRAYGRCGWQYLYYVKVKGKRYDCNVYRGIVGNRFTGQIYDKTKGCTI